MSQRSIVPLSNLLTGLLPTEWVSEIGDALSKIGIDPAASQIVWDPRGFFTRQRIVIREPIALDLPLISGAQLYLGSGAGDLPTFDVGLRTEPTFTISIEDFEFGLHFPPDVLQRYRRQPDTEVWEADPDTTGFDLTFSTSVTFDMAGNLSLSAAAPRDLAPVMIGDTGLIIDLDRVEVVSGVIPEELRDQVPYDFTGLWISRAAFYYIKAGTKLPPFELLRAGLGNGGFTGTVSLGERTRAEEDIPERYLVAPEGGTVPELPSHLVALNPAGSSMNELSVIFQYLGLTFVQSIPTSCLVTGHLFMPFVEQWMKFKASLGGPDSDFLLEIGGAMGDPLISLENEWFLIEADSLAYFTKDGLHYVQVSGSIKPKLGGLDWPKLKADKLTIGSDGTIDIEGGWLDLPESFTLDFNGFRIGLTQIGMGSEKRNEGTSEERELQWFGVSGSVALVEGIPISASVDGLKFTWPKEGPGDVDVSLTGISASLEIPDTLKLSGSMSYRELHGDDNPDGLSGYIFSGHIDLDIIALRTEVAGELICGRLTDPAGHEFTAFYIVLDAELPAPIPLGATGVGIYGMAGLFGAHVAPDRHLVEDEPEAWYEWYKADRGNASSYSVTSIKKWKPLYDNWAFGAGLTLGTQFDDGFTFNIKALVALLLPGPVIMIEGRANLLKQRSGQRTQEGAFYALVVFDGRAGTFQLNVDVRYSVEGVVSISGGMEAFFDFNDSTAWYVHIGKKEPESKRIQAEILSLVKASTYFMIDATALQIGAFIGVEWSEEYGPVKFALVARFSFEAAIFWKPLQVEGSIELYGEIVLTIFGIGLELILQLLLEARAPTPYWIHGKAKLKLSLPWPLPTIDVEAEFTWEEPADVEAILPVVKGAALLHHRVPGASWQLLERSLDGFAEKVAAVLARESPPNDAQIFPTDARAVISLTRPVTGLSANPTSSLPQRFAEIEPDHVGDFELAYKLFGTTLERFEPETRSWTTVRSGLNGADATSFAIDDFSFLPGWDAHEPQLELWRNHALDTVARAAREEISDRYPPCVTVEPARERCIDWQLVPVGTEYDASFRYQGVYFRTAVTAHDHGPTVELDAAHAVRHLVAPAAIHIVFPVPAADVRLKFLGTRPIMVAAWCRGSSTEAVTTSTSSDMTVTIEGPVDTVSISVNATKSVPSRPILSAGPSAFQQAGSVRLVSVCSRDAAELRRERAAAGSAGRTGDPASAGESLVLEPNRAYRLTVAAGVDGDHRGAQREFHYYYFKTDNGPGTVPEGAPAPHVKLPINTLSAYVARSIPAHGARSHYLTYDLNVEFDEPYVAGLYRESLVARVRDQNGKMVGEPNGDLVALGLPLLPRGLLTLLGSLDLCSCDVADPSPPRRLALLRDAPSQLRARRLYKLELVCAAWDQPNTPLHTVQFTTSRYRDFTEHLRSGITDGAQVVRVGSEVTLSTINTTAHQQAVDSLAAARVAVRAAIEAEDWPRVAECLTATVAASAALDDASAALFAELAAAAGFGTEELPPAVELVSAPRSGREQRLVLLESPEPLDWSRIALELKPVHKTTGPHDRSVPPIPLRLVWNRDRTRTWILSKAEVGLAPQLYNFQFSYQGDGAPELAVASVGGTPVTEAVSWRCEL